MIGRAGADTTDDAVQPANRWEFADQVSGKIVAVLKAEMKDPNFSAVQLLAGLLLGLLGLLKTVPPALQWPRTLTDLQTAAEACVASIKAFGERGGSP